MSSKRRRPRISQMHRRPVTPRILVLSTVLLFSLAPWRSPSAAEAKDSCVACHSKASFLVTNKKLYDYFQRWESSVHKQEGVTCVDCHGGNRQSSDKNEAHQGNLRESEADSAVNFRNISKTCGGCHQDIYQGFRNSIHFEHLVSKDQEDRGPTCVTCHGSLNVAALNVGTVEEVCRQCHNEETENSPKTPGEARALLNRFLSIHRYYRYITARSDAHDAQRFFGEVNPRIHDLSVTWHTFDLKEIGEKTEAVLHTLKTKREEIAEARKKGEDNRHRSPD